jgi:hypothetical protein
MGKGWVVCVCLYTHTLIDRSIDRSIRHASQQALSTVRESPPHYSQAARRPTLLLAVLATMALLTTTHAFVLLPASKTAAARGRGCSMMAPPSSASKLTKLPDLYVRLD